MDNRRGIGLMVFAMAGFAVADACIKGVSDAIPPGQIVVFLTAPGAVVFAAIAIRRGIPLLSRDALLAPALVRIGGEILATLCLIVALGLIPLATVAAVQQAVPLAVTAGAALVFAEQVGWRRWAAIATGFAGVLMILRPGADAFDPATLFAVAAVAGFAVRDLATWAVPARISTHQLAFWAMLATSLSGALLMAATGSAWSMPSAGAAVALGFAIAASLVAYWAITEAMRAGEISAIAPFRYSRLVFALAVAIAIFGERPDGWTLAGAAAIIGTGLYTISRERRARRAAPTAAAPLGTDMTP